MTAPFVQDHNRWLMSSKCGELVEDLQQLLRILIERQRRATEKLLRTNHLLLHVLRDNEKQTAQNLHICGLNLIGLHKLMSYSGRIVLGIRDELLKVARQSEVSGKVTQPLVRLLMKVVRQLSHSPIEEEIDLTRLFPSANVSTVMLKKRAGRRPASAAERLQRLFQRVLRAAEAVAQREKVDMIMWASTRPVIHNNLIHMASQMPDRDGEAFNCSKAPRDEPPGNTFIPISYEAFCVYICIIFHPLL